MPGSLAWISSLCIAITPCQPLRWRRRRGPARSQDCRRDLETQYAQQPQPCSTRGGYTLIYTHIHPCVRAWPLAAGRCYVHEGSPALQLHERRLAGRHPPQGAAAGLSPPPHHGTGWCAIHAAGQLRRQPGSLASPAGSPLAAGCGAAARAGGALALGHCGYETMHVLPANVPGRLPARPLRHAVQVQHQATSASRVVAFIRERCGNTCGTASGIPWLQRQILDGLQLGSLCPECDLLPDVCP